MSKISEHEKKGDFIVFSAMMVKGVTEREAIHRATIACHPDGGNCAIFVSAIARTFEDLAVEKAREKISNWSEIIIG